MDKKVTFFLVSGLFVIVSNPCWCGLHETVPSFIQCNVCSFSEQFSVSVITTAFYSWPPSYLLSFCDSLCQRLFLAIPSHSVSKNVSVHCIDHCSQFEIRSVFSQSFPSSFVFLFVCRVGFRNLQWGGPGSENLSLSLVAWQQQPAMRVLGY